jgi:hypothetical protein
MNNAKGSGVTKFTKWLCQGFVIKGFIVSCCAVFIRLALGIVQPVNVFQPGFAPRIPQNQALFSRCNPLIY